MIQPLRRAHLRIWIVLTIVIPLTLFVALLARHPAPSNPFTWESFK